MDWKLKTVLELVAWENWKRAWYQKWDFSELRQKITDFNKRAALELVST